MKNELAVFTVVLLSAIGVGCDNFEYHPYSIGLDGNHDINNKNMAVLERSDIQVPFKFAFITDTQGALDETEEALEVMKERGDIDFIVHGGDMTDFGLPKEFVWGRDIFDRSGIPYVMVIGNHDCLGNGEDTFNYLFGPQNYSFNVGCVHFLCLNTVALEYDYSNPVPDLDFIENDYTKVMAINEAVADSITHTVVAMHSRPYDEQFNNNVAKAFNFYLTNYPGFGGEDFNSEGGRKGFCMNGHNHSLDIADIFGNGILYYQCPNIEKRMFFVFTITKDGYSQETVEF